MRMAIMQPYFFPYLGHFSLIAAVDEWIVFDITQYTPRTWMNRNRILGPQGGWQWLTVPLARSSIHMRTHEAAVQDLERTRQGMLGRLGHYRRAPYWRGVSGLVEDTFATTDPSLTRLNARGLDRVCQYLGLPFHARVCSELAIHLPDSPGPGQWAPAICAALGADTYVNPAGGEALFDPADFDRCGVKPLLLESEPFTYQPGQHAFEAGLSILDVLMWNPPDAVRAALDCYRLMPLEQRPAIKHL